ncbi:MAG TPA: hypothetical protein V6C81_02180 [Planktothrix sp.]
MKDINQKDEGGILFKNAVARLQGLPLLQFPADSVREQVSLSVSVHFGDPPQSFWKDAFGKDRMPVRKWNW